MTDALLGMILVVLLWKLFPPPGWQGLTSRDVWEALRYALFVCFGVAAIVAGSVYLLSNLPR
jgi:hypothetical protein